MTPPQQHDAQGREPQGRDAFEPIFIVGCPRSGTTLLAAMLDRHSLIAVPPETLFFRDILPRLPRGATLHETLVTGFMNGQTTAHLHLERDVLEARFRRYAPDAPHLLRAVLEEYAARQGKLRPAEKTPVHLHYVPLILRWYPRAKVICLVRDGRDVALSMMRVPWAHDDLRLHSLMWNECARLALRFEKQFPDRFLRLPFEALVNFPVESLQAVDSFVGVPFEARQLDISIETAVVPEWENDWKAKAKSAPDAARGGAWKRAATPSQKCLMNAAMRRFLRRLGYRETTLRNCPAAQRAALRLTTAMWSLPVRVRVSLLQPRLHNLLYRWRRGLARIGFDFDRV